MNTVILLLILIIIWVMSLIASFVAGFYYKLKKKPFNKTKPLTEAEKREFKRIQAEYENFMNYNGTPQDVISD